jgi:hypothetical protein
MKKIKCIETDMIYESARQAGQALNISYKTISKCINGKAKSAGGYHFIAISESDILPQATNQISDILEKSPSDKSKEKVADMKKSPTQKVADNTSDLLEKSPQEKSPMVTHCNTDTVNTVNVNTNNHDWFTKELESVNTPVKTEKVAIKTNIDTELIESLITPATAEIKPHIDKDILLDKWERNKIEQQLQQYIQFPIPLEFKESLVIAFYAYVKQYSSPFIDKMKELENENQLLQEKNESLITELAEHKSEKEALEYLTKEYERVIAPQEGLDMVQTYKDQRDTIQRLSKEKYVLNCHIQQLQEKQDNTTDFTVEYERDNLLKKVAELENQLVEYQDKTLDSMDKTLDKIVDNELNFQPVKQFTESKNDLSDISPKSPCGIPKTDKDSATLRRPTDSPLSADKESKSAGKEISWEDI